MAFFHDDGTEVNPNDIPVPEKCIQCKMYIPAHIAENQPELTVEWDENILCTLTRMDNMDSDEEFECFSFVLNPDWISKLN